MSIQKEVSKAIYFYNLKRYSDAIKIYERIIKQGNLLNKESLSTILYNLGLCWFSIGNWSAAERIFKKSLNMGFDECGYELSMTLLHQGKILEGMGLFEKRDFGSRKKSLDLPILRISKMDQCLHKKVLVLNEEGLGDEILFSLFLREVGKKSSSLWYQVYPENIDLFKEIFKDEGINFFSDGVLTAEFVSGFDCYGYSGDFFADGIINRINPTYFKEKGPESEGIKKIGVLWHTNKKSKNTSERSYSINSLSFLKKREVEVYNLQYGEKIEWMNNPEINSMYDVYKIAEDMDVIITPDTSVAHLCSSLGVETIIAHKNYIDWRWTNNFYSDRYELVKVEFLEEYLFG